MQWLNSLVSEYDSRPLQKSGMLSKDQLARFFEESAKQFNSPEFKQLLVMSLKARGPGAPEEVVNGMQKEIFESMGVQGDFGIKCLARVGQTYGNDAFFLRQFYQHVQMEEMVLDEAELPEQIFKAKYDQLNRFREDMEARLEKLKGMTPEEQAKFMSEIYKEMIAQGAEGDCCNRPEGCAHKKPGGMDAPAAQAGPGTGAAAATAAGPLPIGVPTGGAPGGMSTMSEAEQLAFFSSLNAAPGGK